MFVKLYNKPCNCHMMRMIIMFYKISTIMIQKFHGMGPVYIWSLCVFLLIGYLSDLLKVP